MTTNYHTAIPLNSEATSNLFNTRYSSLDTQITANTNNISTNTTDISTLSDLLDGTNTITNLSANATTYGDITLTDVELINAYVVAVGNDKGYLFNGAYVSQNVVSLTNTRPNIELVLGYHTNNNSLSRPRWKIGIDGSVAEQSSISSFLNSDFQIVAQANAQATERTMLTIERDTGLTTINGTLHIVAQSYSDNAELRLDNSGSETNAYISFYDNNIREWVVNHNHVSNTLSFISYNTSGISPEYTPITLGRFASGGVKLAGNLGFFNTTPISQITISGATTTTADIVNRFRELLTALDDYGLIVDNTT